MAESMVIERIDGSWMAYGPRVGGKQVAVAAPTREAAVEGLRKVLAEQDASLTQDTEG